MASCLMRERCSFESVHQLGSCDRWGLGFQMFLRFFISICVIPIGLEPSVIA